MRYSLIIIMCLKLGISSSGISQNLRVEAKKPLPDLDISEYSLTDLYIIRNSIYANYGYSFKKEWLQSYFDGQEWYEPNPNFTFDLLSKTDFDNANKIIEYEKQKRKNIVPEWGDNFIMKRYHDYEITEPMPDRFRSQIEKEANNYGEGYPSEPPLFIRAKPFDEMSQQEYDEFMESEESYYLAEPLSVVYDSEGNILRFGNKYYDEAGTLVYVSSFINQTTVVIDYYFYWLDDELMQVTIYHYSGADPENTMSKVDIY